MAIDENQKNTHDDDSCDEEVSKNFVATLLTAQLKKLEQIKIIKEKNYEKDKKKLFKSKDNASWEKEFHTADVLNIELKKLITTSQNEDFDYENFDFLKTINDIEEKIIQDPTCSLRKNNKGRFHKHNSKLMTFMIELKESANNIDRSEELNTTLSDMFLLTT